MEFEYKDFMFWAIVIISALFLVWYWYKNRNNPFFPSHVLGVQTPGVAPEAEVIKRSSKHGEDLTHYEKKFIETSLKCPDCETGGLDEGPHGGNSVNYFCNNKECGSKFNLSFFGKKLWFGERISDAQPLKSIKQITN